MFESAIKVIFFFFFYLVIYILFLLSVNDSNYSELIKVDSVLSFSYRKKLDFSYRIQELLIFYDINIIP